MKMPEQAVIPVPEHWLRPLGFLLILIGMALTGAGVIICLDMLFPIYIRLWRQAPIVETAYPVFGAISALLIGPLGLLGGVHLLIFRRPLTSQNPVWLKIAERLLKVASITLLVVSPLLAVGTTAALHVMDYQACNKLRISGSGWQVFWVKNDGFCFRPDSYIEDNWPCKDMDGKTYCLRADGL